MVDDGCKNLIEVLADVAVGEADDGIARCFQPLLAFFICCLNVGQIVNAAVQFDDEPVIMTIKIGHEALLDDSLSAEF